MSDAGGRGNQYQFPAGFSTETPNELARTARSLLTAASDFCRGNWKAAPREKACATRTHQIFLSLQRVEITKTKFIPALLH